MNVAILILGDGETVTLDGRFVLLTETAGDKSLSVVDAYCDGHTDGPGIICNTTHEALKQIAAIAAREPLEP